MFVEKCFEVFAWLGSYEVDQGRVAILGLMSVDAAEFVEF